MRKIECARRQDASGHTITRHCHRSGALQRGRKTHCISFLSGLRYHRALCRLPYLSGTLRLRNRKTLFQQTGAHLSAEKVSCGCAAARCLTSMADGRVPCGISAPTKTICSVFSGPAAKRRTGDNASLWCARRRPASGHILFFASPITATVIGDQKQRRCALPFLCL